MRWIKAGVAALALALAGCINVDMEIAVTGPDQATASGFVEMDRMFHDMAGDDSGFCDPDEGGTLVLTDTAVRCEMNMQGTFAELFPEDGDDEQPRLTDLGNGTVRVEVPMGGFGGELGAESQDPQMLAMLRPMFEGRSIVFRVRGREVVSSNGVISADGRVATLSVPLVSLLDPSATVPDPFETIVRY